MRQDYITITGAAEGNLKDVTLKIPKNKLTVFTGVSGSGKSTLLMDVLYMESQRQYLEAMSFQGIARPKVERIRGVSPAIIISQTDANKNPRSTVGTMTDIYTDLRMIYEKLGSRECPACGRQICAADCVEESEKVNDEFRVYMYCHECGHKMKKLTRTDFSFNTREGACESCEGLGEILDLDRFVTVNETISLENGAVDFWEGKYREYQVEALFAAYKHYGIPVPHNQPVNEYTPVQKEILYEGIESGRVKCTFPDTKPPKTVSGGKFEGIRPALMRRLANQNGEGRSVKKYFHTEVCPACRGERLGSQSRKVTVNGVRLPEVSVLSLHRLLEWLRELTASLDKKRSHMVKDYLLDIETKILRFLKVGLGYLSLDRQTVSLSGGELQRLKLAAVLDSDLTGIIYILDEPSSGLHPKDTKGLISVLYRLRDMGNTVLVIEHDTDVMTAADYVVDIGPGSGKYGGNIMAAGTLPEIMLQPESVTGKYLQQKQQDKNNFRSGTGAVITVRDAVKYNLKHVDVDIPAGCFTAVTGASGSGKSTLVFEVLAQGSRDGKQNRVSGCEAFEQVVKVGQSPINRMKRSNIATYMEVYTDIRNIFARQNKAKEAGLTARDFSFNSPGGRCESCEGMGTVYNHLLFFKSNEVVCPVCRGKRFKDHVLAVTYQGLSVKEVLELSVMEALAIFKEYPRITRTLELLTDVGLDYLELGQSLTTLSGGEGQRLKLARELTGNMGKRSLYLIDEPTRGLHPLDVEHFLVLLNRIVDSGSTVVVVEHNQQIIKNSDWVIDLGPGGGEDGGKVVFTGTPEAMIKKGTGVTAECLRGSCTF